MTVTIDLNPDEVRSAIRAYLIDAKNVPVDIALTAELVLVKDGQIIVIGGVSIGVIATKPMDRFRSDLEMQP